MRGVVIGGGAPISVQSMTTTRTADAEATIAQIRRLAEAGCQIVRVATPTPADTAALPAIVAGSPIPVVADVHFHFQRALEAVAAGVHKIRLNPGNIGDRGQVRRVIDACRRAGVAIRVGVNEGSIAGAERRAPAAAPEADLPARMVGVMEQYLAVFAEEGFEQLVLSAKSHDARTCIEVYRLLSRRWDWPLHVGLTHAGTAQSGLVRSAAAVGALLAEGIGDTVRISLAGDPVQEVLAGRELLACLHLRVRREVEIIACPTCGRTTADVADLAQRVQQALAGVRRHVTVAVMGCVVNGPGEAQWADVAACCGGGKAAIYRRGRVVATVPQEQIVSALVAQVELLLKDEPDPAGE